MGRKRRNIVIVDNKAVELNYVGFSVNEMRLWFALLAEVRDRGTSEIELSFDEFATLAGVSKSTPSYIMPLASATARKIQAMTALDVYDADMDINVTWFFKEFKISPKSSKIKFEVK